MERQLFIKDARGVASTLRENPIGGKIVSADTSMHRLAMLSGSNTGVRDIAQFELTGEDWTSGPSLDGYYLEITEAGYEQVRRIDSTTNANPGEITIFRGFSPALHPSNAVSYLIYPYLLNPLTIKFSPTGTGNLSLYRTDTQQNETHLATLLAGETIEIPISDISKIRYVFSVFDAVEDYFFWGEPGFAAAGGGGGGGPSSNVSVINSPTVVITEPLQIDGTGTAGAVPVEGTVDIGTMPPQTIAEPLQVDGVGTAGRVVVEGKGAAQEVTVEGTVAVSSVSGTTTIDGTGTAGAVPVEGTVSVTEPVTVDGTINVGNSPTVVITEPLQIDGTGTANAVVVEGAGVGGELTVDGTVNVGTVAGTVTVAEPVTVDGTVNVGTTSGTVTVDGTGVGSRVVVEGKGAAQEVTVEGTVAVSSVSGTTRIDGTGTAGAVPVEGTVSVTEPVTVDGTGVGSRVVIEGKGASQEVTVEGTVDIGTMPTVTINDTNSWSSSNTISTIRANYTAAQTDTAIVTAGVAETITVTRCTVTADNANTVDVQARVGFGTATTPTGAGVVLSHPGIAPGSGVVEGTGSGILGVGLVDEDLRITSEVPTGGSIDVVVSYILA